MVRRAPDDRQNRRNPMPPISKTFTALLGGVVFALIFASTAAAACVDSLQSLRQTTLVVPPRPTALGPRAAGAGQPARVEDNGRHGGLVDRIVGTWLVTYTGALPGQAFIQWHDDGTEWENIHLPILGGTICMGDWKAIDENHVRRSHVGWLYDDKNGSPAGYFTQTETDEVARDGSWYRGTNHITVYDSNGNLLFEGDGTAEAARIPQP
jgi:hypothetical protein